MQFYDYLIYWIVVEVFNSSVTNNKLKISP